MTYYRTVCESTDSQTMHAGKSNNTLVLFLSTLNLVSSANSQIFIHLTHFKLKDFKSEQLLFISSDNETRHFKLNELENIKLKCFS